MDGMGKQQYIKIIRTIIESPRNNEGKIDMLRACFEQFLHDAENKIMFQRPENLNPMQEGHEDYNKGWNDCSSYWINLLHNYDKENEVEIERLPNGDENRRHD